MRLPEAENYQQRFVNAPLLLRPDPADKGADTARVDSANLLDEDAGGRAQDADLGTPSSLPAARARNRYIGLQPPAALRLWFVPMFQVPR
jgi:hypothetical protein